MKIGDLVKWVGTRDWTVTRPDTGIIVDGPDEELRGKAPSISYAVAWFDAKETFWHNDSNLEVLSENR